METKRRNIGTGTNLIKFVPVPIFLLFMGCSVKVPEKVEPPAHVHVAEEIAEPPVTTTVPVIKNATKPKPVEFDEVQLTWQVPKEPVDKYIIYFGFARDSLDKKIELDISTLEEIDDPRFGPIYRYFLVDVPIDRTIYVSIGAMRGSEVSKMGEIVELKAEN